MPFFPSRQVILCGLASMLMLGVLGAALPHQADAAQRDAVISAINRARMARVLTAAEVRSLRLQWIAAARAQRTAPSGSRRSAIAAVRALTTRMAARGQLTPDRVRPAMLSVRATTWVMLHGSYPAHEDEVMIPGEPVVFTYYSGRGVQYQPFETFKQGMREINQPIPDVDAARAIADRMLQLSQQRGTSRTWEYLFPFNGPERPWTSAISQALATEFYWRVGDLVGGADRATYMGVAEQVTRSFLRSTRVGGVGVTQGTGRYYVMYSFNPSQRILNGHLQVLLNVNRYAVASGSAAARRVVALGRAAVLPMMPRFDTGTWSNYQPGQEAELGYHEFQAGQLVKLGIELPDPTFATYGDRFESYLVTPPGVTFPTPSFLAIFPAADGFRDGVDVPVVVDKRSRVTLIVSDSAGVEVDRVSVSGPRGRRVLHWDGTMASGQRAAAGSYTGRLVATDIVGNRGSINLPAPLRVIADTTAPSVRRVVMRSRRGGSTMLAIDTFDMASAHVLVKVMVGKRTLAAGVGKRSGRITFVVHRRLDAVRRGYLLLVDTSGNKLVYPLTR